MLWENKSGCRPGDRRDRKRQAVQSEIGQDGRRWFGADCEGLDLGVGLKMERGQMGQIPEAARTKQDVTWSASPGGRDRLQPKGRRRREHQAHCLPGEVEAGAEGEQVGAGGAAGDRLEQGLGSHLS